MTFWYFMGKLWYKYYVLFQDNSVILIVIYQFFERFYQSNDVIFVRYVYKNRSIIQQECKLL